MAQKWAGTPKLSLHCAAHIPGSPHCALHQRKTIRLYTAKGNTQGTLSAVGHAIGPSSGAHAVGRAAAARRRRSGPVSFCAMRSSTMRKLARAVWFRSATPRRCPAACHAAARAWPLPSCCDVPARAGACFPTVDYCADRRGNERQHFSRAAGVRLVAEYCTCARTTQDCDAIATEAIGQKADPDEPKC